MHNACLQNRLSFLVAENKSKLPVTMLDSAAPCCTVKGNLDLFAAAKRESLALVGSALSTHFTSLTFDVSTLQTREKNFSVMNSIN